MNSLRRRKRGGGVDSANTAAQDRAMTKSSIAKVLAVVAGVAVTSMAAPAGATPEKGKVFGDWVIDCETGTDKAEHCFAAQTQTETVKDQKPARLLKVSIGYIGPKGAPAMVAILPLGIYLPAGVAYQVDKAPQHQLVVQRCVAAGCVAAAAVDERVLAALRRGQRMVIGVKGDPAGQTITISVSLKGLDAAIRSLK